MSDRAARGFLFAALIVLLGLLVLMSVLMGQTPKVVKPDFPVPPYMTPTQVTTESR